MGARHTIGSYALYDPLGSGGMASVHLGVRRGASPLVPVAIKRLHADQARSAAAVARLLDEVRLVRHVAHPNVVGFLDFVSDGEEMLAVMEYVHGEPLARLLAEAGKEGGGVPAPIAVAIVADALTGLHAAHEARDGAGKPLELVHRDVTPDNILVGEDGVARLADFGVAKATGRLHATRDGGVRGKLAYLAPEQVGGTVTRRTDTYAAALVLWEALVGRRALAGDDEAALLCAALAPDIPAPSREGARVSPALDAVLLRALAVDPDARFATAAGPG